MCWLVHFFGENSLPDTEESSPFSLVVGENPVILKAHYLHILFCSFIAIGGVLSAFAPSYYWLIMFRSCVGFGVGGVYVPFDLLAEFLPPARRGKFLIYIEFFWTFGSLMVAGLAWLLLPSFGWRVLTFVTAIPVTGPL